MKHKFETIRYLRYHVYYLHYITCYILFKEYVMNKKLENLFENYCQIFFLLIFLFVSVARLGVKGKLSR